MIDEKWRDHLHEIDILKEGIYLRAYAQKDPLLEYKGEAFRMFDELMAAVEADTVKLLFRVVPVSAPTQGPVAQARPGGASTPRAEPAIIGAPVRRQPVAGAQETVHTSVSAFGGGGVEPPPQPGKPRPVVRKDPHVGRNDPCPCGSGKKYKKCCGADE